MNDEFDQVFGGRTGPPITFTDRVARPAATTPPPAELAAGSGLYKPYGFLPSGIGETCDVRRWIDGTAIAEGIEFQYRFLMQVGYVGTEQLRLLLPDCLVFIEGTNLTELRRRLARRQVTFIQQYHSTLGPAPSGDEAVIATVELRRP